MSLRKRFGCQQSVNFNRRSVTELWVWRAGFCRIKQIHSLGARLVSCPSDPPWAREVTPSGDFSFAPIYLTHSTGENADFPASAGAQLCTGGSKTLNTKTSLSTWLGKNRQWENRGQLCRQLALSIWMFVCFFPPHGNFISDTSVCNVEYLFPEATEILSVPQLIFFGGSCDWRRHVSAGIFPFLISSGEYIKICRLLKEDVFGLSINWTTKDCSFRLRWPISPFRVGLPELKLRKHEACQQKLVLPFRSLY